MAANITVTRKARGTGQYAIQTPAGVNVIRVSSTGTLAFFTGAGSAQGLAIADANNAASAITQQNLILALLRTRGDIAT